MISTEKRSSFWRNAMQDPEFWFLFLFNGFLYYEYRMDPGLESTIIMVFYFQSVIIGVFHFVKLLYFGETRQETVNTEVRLNTETTSKVGAAVFFAFHYGMFHFVYFIFLLIITLSGDTFPDLRMMGASVGMFALNCLISFISDVRKSNAGKPPRIHFFTPYARVIPMHLTIMLGFFVSVEGEKGAVPWWTFGLGVFEVFMLLKLIADLITFAATRENKEEIKSE